VCDTSIQVCDTDLTMVNVCDTSIQVCDTP